MIKLYKKKFISNSPIEYEYKYEFEGYLPKVIKTGYKKPYKSVWEATVLVKRDETNEKVLNNLKDYLFQIYDKNGEYIGAFIPNKPDEAILNRQSTITINCNHALITLLDSIFPEDIEVDSEDVNSLFARVLSHQKQRIWEYRGAAHANEATDIKLEKQNGLLNPFLKIAERLSPLYYFAYDTEGEFPWGISLNKVTDTPTARIREGYNLLDYKLTSDPSNIYNRLYAYGEVEELTYLSPNHRVNAEEIQKENAAWSQYQYYYAAWKKEQIRMQEDRDRVLKRREELVKSGASASELPKLPPRPSTLKPPEKPSISSREMLKNRVTIASVNPTRKEYLEDIDSIKTYGLKERILEFKEISDPALLYNTAKKIFENRTNEVYDYSINAADLNKLLVKPIPFDWIRLGTTISFQTYRAGKAIEDDLVIVEESKQDIDGEPEKISVTLQLKNAASAPTVSNSTASQLLSKIEETEADIIKAYKSADGKNTIYAGKDQPPDPKVNDIWYKQTLDDTGKPKIEMWLFNGDIWINPFDDIDKISQLIEDNEKELDKFDNENKTLMATLKDDIDALNSDVANANKQIRDEIIAKTNELNEQLKNLDTKLSKDLNDKVDNINSTISTLEQNFKDSLDNKEAEILQQTKIAIDEKLQTITATIGKQETKLGELVTTITNITASLDGLNAKVIAVEASENEQNKKLSDLDVSVNGIKTTVANLQESQTSTTKLINETKQTAEANKQAISKETSNREAAIKATNEKISTATSEISKLSETVQTNNETATSKINEVVKDVNSTKETIASLSSGNDARFNKIEKDVNSNTSTIASYKTKIDSNAQLAETNASKINQTDTKIENIVTSYAKKSDLNGFMNEEQVTTIATVEAGKIKTTLSSQIITIDDKINGVKAHPPYTIGDDGYWYKDGQKTSTKAIGADGKTGPPGKDGSAFKWNLLDDGNSPWNESDIDEDEMPILDYEFGQDIPEGAIISLTISYVGYYNHIRLSYNEPRRQQESHFKKDFEINIPEPSDASLTTYTVTTQLLNSVPKGSFLLLHLSKKPLSSYKNEPFTLNWCSIVLGDQPVKEFVPSMNDINAKVLTKISTLEYTIEGFKATVQNQNYLSIINQQADKQIFQVSNGKTTGKMMITPETVYIQDATIKSSHIASLSANKITAGTIDASRIRVININANNITTGKISGYRGYWNLNNGEFYNGEASNNIRLCNGVAKFADSRGEGIVIESGRITLSTNITASSSYTQVGDISGSSIWNEDPGVKNVRLAHLGGTTMTLSFYDGSNYKPYIVFDYYGIYRYNIERNRDTPLYAPIMVETTAVLRKDVMLQTHAALRVSNNTYISAFEAYTTQGYTIRGMFIGNAPNGLYICNEGIFTFLNGSAYNLTNTSLSIDRVNPLVTS